MIAWGSIVYNLLLIAITAPIILSIVYIARRISVQSNLCSAISKSDAAEVRGILLIFSHFLKAKQRDNANMFLMANGDPLLITPKELEEGKKKEDNTYYGY